MSTDLVITIHLGDTFEEADKAFAYYQKKAQNEEYDFPVEMNGKMIIKSLRNEGHRRVVECVFQGFLGEPKDGK